MKTQLTKAEKPLAALLCIVLSCCIGLMVPIGAPALAVEKQVEVATQAETEHQPAATESEATGSVTELAANYSETDSVIDLTWKWAEAKGAYTVYQAVDDGTYAKVADGLVSEATKASVSVKEIDGGHTYSYFVETNNDGATHKTEAAVVEVPAIEDATPSREVVDNNEPTVVDEEPVEEATNEAATQAATEQDIAMMSEDAAETEVSTQAEKDAKTIVPMSSAAITYRTHVQNDGWQGWKSNGTMSGTQGRALRLEGINIKVSGLDGGIEYRTHVQNDGWQGWKSNGTMSGTQGRSLRLEAIQIRLTGNAAKQYDVYYRVHTENIGWMGWASNGEQSGSAGYSYRLEGIQIVLVAKGSAAPSNVGGISSVTASKFVNYNATSDLTYNTTLHIQDYGDRTYNNNNGSKMMGTSGEAKRLERFSIALNNNTGLSGNIRYRTHVQNIGWQDWKANGQAAGTSGRSLRLEALQIYLDGDLGKNYDIYYQVHVQNIGWQDWKSNGVVAGTSGKALRLEAMRIVIVKKGDVPPTSNTSASQFYTVTFKNWNGSVLDTHGVDRGTPAVYHGPTPTKPSSGATSYTFTGWSPVVTASTTDVTYTAQFAAHTKQTYTVKFTGYDNPITYGAESKQDNFMEGSKPVAPTWGMSGGQRETTWTKDGGLVANATISTPQKTQGCYAFTGWKSSQNGQIYQSNNLPAVSGNVTYTAQWKNLGYESYIPTTQQENTTSNKFYPQADLIKKYWEQQKACHQPAFDFYNVTVIRAVVASTFEREWASNAGWNSMLGESTGFFKFNEQSLDFARVIEYNNGNPVITYYARTLS